MVDQDPLETLREQVRAATEAAERLVREVGDASGSAQGGSPAGREPLSGTRRAASDPPTRPGERRARAVRGAAGSWPPRPSAAPSERRAGASVPPAGWDSRRESETTAELQALASVLQSLRDLLPADLQEQLTEVIRQVLLLLRALIDWVVMRLERGEPGREVPVEDIPIS
jgi:hypothetical protein